METQNTFATILENESVTVSAVLCAETLKINVKVNDETNEHFGSVFTAEITEQQRKENLNDYFDNLNEVLQFMEKDKLIKVNLEERIITLYEITKLKKQISLLTSELTKEEIIIEEKDDQNSQNPQSLQNLQFLEQISNRCLQKSEIQNDQIKKYFEIIANELITLRKEKVDKNEQNEMKSQLLNQKQQFKKIHQQISELEEQNEKKNETLEQKSQEKFAEFTDKIYELSKNNSLQNEKIESLEMKITDKTEKIEELSNNLVQVQISLPKQSEKLKENFDFCLQKLKKQTEQLISQKNKIMQDKLMVLETQMNNLNEIVKEQRYEPQQSQVQGYQQKQISFISKCKKQKQSSCFNFDGKTLTKIKNQERNVGIFAFFEQIVFPTYFTFQIKIIEMEKKISIGVIDYEDFDQDQLNDSNCICYFSNSAQYPKAIKKGNGFKIGDSVTVVVNRKAEEIKYFVNDKLQVTLQGQILRNQKQKLFPCVRIIGLGKVQLTF